MFCLFPDSCYSIRLYFKNILKLQKIGHEFLKTLNIFIVNIVRKCGKYNSSSYIYTNLLSLSWRIVIFYYCTPYQTTCLPADLLWDSSRPISLNLMLELLSLHLDLGENKDGKTSLPQRDHYVWYKYFWCFLRKNKEVSPDDFLKGGNDKKFWPIIKWLGVIGWKQFWQTPIMPWCFSWVDHPVNT